MRKIKDTQRSTVRLSYDGRVQKVYRGPKARERFETEVRILRHLAGRKCSFVPTLLEAQPERLTIWTTSCGQRVDHLSEEKRADIFAELEAYGVKHDDPDIRNVTYSQQDGRFCIVDFEFATLLPEPA